MRKAMTPKEIRKERKRIDSEIKKRQSFVDKSYNKLYSLYNKCKHPDKYESPPTTDAMAIYECPDCGALGFESWFRDRVR